MNRYSYTLYSGPNDRSLGRGSVLYSRSDLEEMTTYQLRNICYKEKLVAGVTKRLDREGYIRTILNFRSADNSLFINTYAEGGFDRVEEALQKYLNTRLQDTDKIQVPAIMTLYAGMRLDQQDHYRVEASNGISESNVLLVNDQMELCGILNLVKDAHAPGVFWLATDKHVEIRKRMNQQYSLLFFRKQDSEYLYHTYYQKKPLPPANFHYYKVPVADLTIAELEETDAVLAIDFGTTNTTAGAYLHHGYITSPPAQELLNGTIRLDQINIVSYPNAHAPSEGRAWVLPTVVSVADCSDHANIVYEYGYDALKQKRRNSYSSQATVFHGIKRWVNGYDKAEEIMDAAGNTAIVKRSDVLRAYLLHVIDSAEHQFKCKFKRLHLSCPVKMKAQFLDMFTEVLPEYEIESEHSLDEGMAVLYNTIADLIDKNNFLPGESYKALVIDCGGGTTDLSSCEFQIEDGHISYKVDIHTAYENGDTNFGGNNITYRIFQYMKIAFANYYLNGKATTDIDELIHIPGTDLFRYVDEFGIDAVYEHFLARYREAESVIPTGFKHYESRSRDDYYRVRSNFHMLWEMAENMKQQFYRRTGVLRNRFHAESETDLDHDMQVTTIERWHLSIMEQGAFHEVYDCPDIVFNIKEINHLIMADIYEIVRKFLDDFYQEGRLQDYSVIKLTGQSCRIDMFREALKEFVPGRSIEFRQKADHTNQAPELKLACLRGAIRYLSARKNGIIEAKITQDAPIVPYQLMALTHNKHEKVLMNSYARLDQVNGFISRPMGVQETEFYLRESTGELRRKIVYRNKADSYQPVTYDEIARLYGLHISQDDTDSIINGEVKLFVFGTDNSWGFHVVPVARQHEQLYMGLRSFHAFDDDLSELDFFDGCK